MNRNQLVNIFKDTEKYSETLESNIDTNKHNFSEITKKFVSGRPNITAINSDSVTASVEYSKLGKTCILNMASYKHPGGGVTSGAKAQEECLFRCSNLHTSMTRDFYPLEFNECLYTTDAVFFKDFHYQYMKPTTIDVVSVAAINLNFQRDLDDTEYLNVMMNKMRLMLTLPVQHDCENIILGAWGCGVFNNDPNKVSEMFKNVMIRENFGGFYKNVVFAVINDHNSVDSNYEIFKSTLH